jgi:pimeloyl-ACP methyl ester carboxylesterase
METGSTVDLQGIEIYCVSLGTGEPIFVLGGPWFGQYYLRQFNDELAKTFRVIAYDPRGSGRSSRLTQADISLAGHLADLDGLRRSLGIDKMNLIAHSMGALVAILFAGDRPETMASLVLMHPGPPFDEHLRKQMHTAFVSRFTPGDRSEMKRISSSSLFREGDAKSHEDYFRILYSPFFTDRALLSQLNFAFTPTTAKYAASAEEHLLPLILAMDPTDKLGQIRCPTMIVHAQNDLIPEVFSKSLAEGIPGAEYVLLEGLGHFAYLEDTRRATTPIIDFVHKVAG